MTIHTRVLILAKDDRLAGPLADGLDRLGWRTVTARSPHAALAALGDLGVQAAVVDVESGGMDAYQAAAQLKAAAAPRRLPVIALGRPEPATRPDCFDLMLAPPLHPAQAANRLESLIREAIAEEEFALRRETFAERGRTLEPPIDAGGPWRVLAVGEPSPEFLALSHALRSRGAQVVAAFTTYTAFDYLHDGAFDAVVLEAGPDVNDTLSISAGMRRNTRLYHTPVLLNLQPEQQINLSEAYHRGVSDIAGPGTPEGDTAARVVELARVFRRQNAMRAALDQAKGSGLMDAATGLYTRDLFAGHLGRLARASEQSRRDLSVAVLRVADRPEVLRARAGGWLDRAIPQIGSMIGRLIRTEDTAARLSAEVFALALPGTSHRAARSAGERIAAVIGCTAFDAGQGAPPFVLDFDIGAAQIAPGEHPAAALERASAASLQKAG
ncbi:MAG: diguanylate cyclase [Pseudomonadota bacterium]|nr:diguanylate cyclase [Pseudomonadota bacterium]